MRGLVVPGILCVLAIVWWWRREGAERARLPKELLLEAINSDLLNELVPEDHKADLRTAQAKLKNGQPGLTAAELYILRLAVRRMRMRLERDGAREDVGHLLAELANLEDVRRHGFRPNRASEAA